MRIHLVNDKGERISDDYHSIEPVKGGGYVAKIGAKTVSLDKNGKEE